MELTPAERVVRDAGAARDAALNPAHKKRAGVVHTPPEIARFMARAADALARRELGLAHGLADSRLAIVDPACGPGAFLAAASAVLAHDASRPRLLCGLDQDAAALEQARVALWPELERARLRCTFEQRDTLHEAMPSQVAQLAPTLCVLGNPPWIGSAQAPPSPWISQLLEDFRRDADGMRLPERKLGVLSDAYVRFLRWACEVARCARQGALLALVTNGSYLDGPVHRALRAALRRWFHAVYVLDLGGSALLARSGARDENVFGVRPSAAILLCARRAGHDERGPLANVHYARVRGTLSSKLERLAAARLSELPWRVLAPGAPFHRFSPAAEVGGDYPRFVSLAEAMPFHREGVQTNRDAAVVDCDRVRLVERMRCFGRGGDDGELAQAARALSHYDPECARRAVTAALERDPDGTCGLLVRRLAYRPFDTRWFVPVAPLCHRPRPELLAAVERSVLVLVSVRKDRGELPWTHVTAARDVPDNCLLSARSSCRARAFPTSDALGYDNLELAVASVLSERIGRAARAVDFAQYALAVLSSPEYRARFDEALRADYPRVPWPRDAACFEALRQSGEHIAALLSAPLPSVECEAVPSPSSPLAIDAERGAVRLGAERVCGIPASAFTLRIGHHRPLHDLARAAGRCAASAARVRALCARLEALAAAIAELTELPL